MRTVATLRMVAAAAVAAITATRRHRLRPRRPPSPASTRPSNPGGGSASRARSGMSSPAPVSSPTSDRHWLHWSTWASGFGALGAAQHAKRQLGRELAGLGAGEHAHSARSSLTRAARSRRQAGAHPGLGRPERDALHLADLACGQAEETGEHQRPPLLGGKPRHRRRAGGRRRRAASPARREGGRRPRDRDRGSTSGSIVTGRRTRTASIARLRVMVSSHVTTVPRRGS